MGATRWAAAAAAAGGYCCSKGRRTEPPTAVVSTASPPTAVISRLRGLPTRRHPTASPSDCATAEPLPAATAELMGSVSAHEPFGLSGCGCAGGELAPAGPQTGPQDGS